MIDIENAMLGWRGVGFSIPAAFAIWLLLTDGPLFLTGGAFLVAGWVLMAALRFTETSSSDCYPEDASEK